MATPRLRQVCLVAPALAAPERALAAVLGAASCHRDPHLARYGLENVIFRLGDRFIEIVAPIEDGTAAGRFLERSGGRGGYMAIFDCEDPERRARDAEALGVPVVNRMRVDAYLGGHVPALDIPEYIALYQAGRLPVDKLLTHRMKLEGINEGFDRLADGDAIRQVILFD